MPLFQNYTVRIEKTDRRHKKFFNLHDENIQSVQNIGQQFWNDDKNKEIVDENGPFQPLLVGSSEIDFNKLNTVKVPKLEQPKNWMKLADNWLFWVILCRKKLFLHAKIVSYQN